MVPSNIAVDFGQPSLVGFREGRAIAREVGNEEVGRQLVDGWSEQAPLEQSGFRVYWCDGVLLPPALCVGSLGFLDDAARLVAEQDFGQIAEAGALDSGLLAPETGRLAEIALPVAIRPLSDWRGQNESRP